MNEFKYKFLKDTDELDKKNLNFFHVKFAESFSNILLNTEDNIHTIGLFGKWGSGKSTIVKLLKNDQKLKAEKYKLIEFDCWKYEDDSFRRQLIRKIAKELINKDIREIDLKLYYSENRKKEGKFHFSIKKSILFFLYTLITCLLYFNFKNIKNWSDLQNIKFENYFKFGLVTSSILIIITKYFFNELKSIFQLTDLAYTKNKADSIEIFEDEFINIINYRHNWFKRKFLNKNIKNNFTKLFLIIDNIDRVDSSKAKNILATLKTFLEIKDVKSKLVFIVPCDYTAIKNTFNNDFQCETADEYIRKIFNLIVWMPEFIDLDVSDYIAKLLKESVGENPKINNESVIKIINIGFSKSPREIKQFINNLLAAIDYAINTEVKDLIENNIPFFTKILLIKQKFPEEHEKIKYNWYNINNLQNESKNESFKNFMEETKLIFNEDADPYIYFKKPELSKELPNYNILIDNLKYNKQDKVNEQLELYNAYEINEKYIQLICYLLKRFKGVSPFFDLIIKTHLCAVNSLDLKIINKNYFNDFVKAINSNAIPIIKNISPDIIFERLLYKKENIEHNQIKELIEAYITLLASGNEFTEDLKVEKVFANLINFHKLLNLEQINRINSIINEKDYAINADIMILFNIKEIQDLYLNNSSYKKFIKSITLNNLDKVFDVLSIFKTKLQELGNEYLNEIFTAFVNILNAEVNNKPIIDDKLLLIFEKIIDDFNIPFDIDLIENLLFRNPSSYEFQIVSIKLLNKMKCIRNIDYSNNRNSKEYLFFNNASIDIILKLFNSMTNELEMIYLCKNNKLILGNKFNHIPEINNLIGKYLN